MKGFRLTLKYASGWEMFHYSNLMDAIVSANHAIKHRPCIAVIKAIGFNLN